ncbi:hypothetical protein [Nocardiopsis composta]|uniref:Uncharacterized protein n=1 Tax=Nocardiopsis composta TaxID=157465 RepID=A0A7W8QSM5_9ACTN|nr:hypothetical protein [Nocardiopsis composta]MBB5435853.1 hypothetical protein [Nocardiopsis composta]
MSSSDSSGAAPRKGGRRRKTDEAEGSPAPGRRSAGSRRKPGRGGAEDGGKKRGKALPILLGALGLAVVALAVVLVIQFTSSGPEAPADARPSSYTIVYESERMSEVLADQEIDSRPLAEGEMFERDNEEIDSQGITFTLKAKSLEDDCSAAVWGDEAAAALADAGCTQAARAAYDSDDYVGVAALFNLRDAKAAQAVAEALEQPKSLEDKGPGFVANPGGEDPLTRLGTGYSRAEASVNGHYLMVVWAQDKSSEEPTEHQDLTSPLIALNSFKDPLYRRLGEVESNNEFQGGGQGGAETGTGQGTGTDTGAGAETGGTGADAGAGTDQGAGTAPGTEQPAG